MNTIDYFKLQAKNLHRDFKTQVPLVDNTIGSFRYEYSPKYFRIYDIISDFDINEEDFTLMNAQHVIAKIAGFDKWSSLMKVSPPNWSLRNYYLNTKIKLI